MTHHARSTARPTARPTSRLTARLVRLIAVTTVLGVCIAAMLAPTGGEPDPDPDADPTPVDRNVARDSPAAVLGAHEGDCWRGEAPEDVYIPGHVIVRYDDGHTVYSARLVSAALEAAIDGVPAPFDVLAFCR